VATRDVAPRSDSLSRLPSLDGLRAISIALVLFGHVTETADYLAPLGRLHRVAMFGVRVFFVISGYLISTLLFHEMAKTGKVSLAKFYFRRGFRISWSRRPPKRSGPFV
jgi:peptidoglycan/LPS O-acetylase OafA/YrhL